MKRPPIRSIGLSLLTLISLQAFVAVAGDPAKDDAALLNASYVKLGSFHPKDAVMAPDYWMDAALPTTNAPAPRYGHAAVWTGSEMIVWGGTGTSYEVPNDGGRYDPAANSWTAMTTNGAPLGRGGFATIWTGSEMIIWGGYTNDGARYNPAADSWTQMTTLGSPAPRVNNTAVWTGKEMIVWGGQSYISYTQTMFGDGARYNPYNDSWTAMTTNGAPSPRSGHTAVWTGTEMVVWGGVFYSPGAVFADGARYDPVSDSWTAVTTTGAPASNSSGYTAVWTGSEMILWGGLFPGYSSRYNPTTDHWTGMSTNGMPPNTFGAYTAVWTGSEMILWNGVGARYNPSTDSWQPVSASGAPSRRSGHSAVWTGNEMIVWGGSGYVPGNPYYAVPLNDGGRYNPAGTGFTNGAPAARADHTSVWTGSEMIVWGGLHYDGLYDRFFNNGGRYNPVANTWTPLTTNGAPVARAYHSAIWTGTEMIVWGGIGQGTNLSVIRYLNDGGRYNPATLSWENLTTTGAPSGRMLQTTVWTANEMIVWGGTPDGSVYLNDGGRFNPTNNSWTAVSPFGAPTPRGYHTAVWTGSDMIIWGGWNNSVLADGGCFNPSTSTWTGMSTAGAPGGRFSQTAIWTGNEMIVWGGWNTSALNDGGRYQPAAKLWSALSTSGAPAARAYHTAIWTGNEMIVWGGWNNSGFLNDGGGYSPALDRWTAVPTNGAPAGRDGHTAVWTGSGMVVWGGTDGAYFNDTWSYLPAAAAGTLGPPWLTITPAGKGAIISWPYSSTGFVLQQNHNPGTTNWIAAAFAVSTNATSNLVTVPPSADCLFFRLSSP